MSTPAILPIFSCNISATSPLFAPVWDLPPRVCAAFSTRLGGVSLPPFAALNLATHVGDDVKHVRKNRQIIEKMLPSSPIWLNQVHGTKVWTDEAPSDEADAICTRQVGRVAAILTADCLPVLFCDRAGTVVAAAHAGWRGLAAGVLQQTVAAMCVPAHEILVWIGPAIGAAAFEVGGEVLEIFCAQDAKNEAFFQACGEKFLANLPELAAHALRQLGVPDAQMTRSNLCTFSDAEHFFSYRRDGQTGRMASLIWLES